MSETTLENSRHDSPVSPHDRGLAYGDGIFRTLRVQQGRPVAWSHHYRKLQQDCQSLAINCPSAFTMLGHIHKLCRPEENAVVKIIVTRGISQRGYAIPDTNQSSLIITTSALPHYPESYYQQGVRLHLCQLRLALQPRLAGIKHLNRLENVLARSEWHDEYADGLLLDSEDRVIECVSSNIFARYAQTLTTPALQRCGVAGVTRDRIMHLVPSMGYKIHIVDMTLDMLWAADEVIICNSILGVVQVRQIEQHHWPVMSLAQRIQTTLDRDDEVIA